MNPTINAKKILLLEKIAKGLGTVTRFCENPAFHQSTLEHTENIIKQIPATVAQMQDDSHCKINFDENLVRGIAWVHDIGELGMEFDHSAMAVYKAGGKLDAQKDDLEKQTVEMLASRHGSWIFDLWQAYNVPVTNEGKLVKFVDKLDGKSHVLARGVENFLDQDEADVTGEYGRKCVVRQGISIYKRLQEKLRAEFQQNGWLWRPKNDVSGPENFPHAPEFEIYRQ